MYTKYEQWLNEAKSKTGRAWNNKLNRIEEFIRYLESNNLLSKRELQKKNSLFIAYYRWYNDGDFPKFLTQHGVYRGMPESTISDKLEEILTNFLTAILSKYLSKVDRSEVRTSVYIKEIDSVLRSLKEGLYYDVYTYYASKINIDDSNWADLLEKLKTQYIELKDDIAALGYDDVKGRYVAYARHKLQHDTDLWSDELEKKWKMLEKIGDEISDILNKVKESIKQIAKA